MIVTALEVSPSQTSPSASKARPIAGTHLPAFAFATGRDLARHAAQMIARLIRERTELGQKTVLALPTGSTPVGTYRELIRLHQNEGLDFSSVVAFGMDEYYGLPTDSPQSHRVWLTEHFFSHVNLKPENIFCFNSTIGPADIDLQSRRYEESIQNAGGIDLALLGIGRNGHVGFNEPFSVRKSRTRLCTLDPDHSTGRSQRFLR